MITREEYDMVLQNGSVAEYIIASGAYIKSLESQLANSEQLTCKDCSKKLLCEMAQKSKDTFGTKLNEQWFNCFVKDAQ